MQVMNEQTCVLIVEDDECIALLIADALQEEMNVRSLTLHNGKDAIRFLAEQHADFVILDYQLPGANGIEVYDTIRRNARTAQTPILFITANDMRAEFQRRGLAYLRKPFNLFELLTTVEDRLRAPRSNTAAS